MPAVKKVAVKRKAAPKKKVAVPKRKVAKKPASNIMKVSSFMMFNEMSNTSPPLLRYVSASLRRTLPITRESCLFPSNIVRNWIRKEGVHNAYDKDNSYGSSSSCACSTATVAVAGHSMVASMAGPSYSKQRVAFVSPEYSDPEELCKGYYKDFRGMFGPFGGCQGCKRVVKPFNLRCLVVISGASPSLDGTYSFEGGPKYTDENIVKFNTDVTCKVPNMVLLFEKHAGKEAGVMDYVEFDEVFGYDSVYSRDVSHHEDSDFYDDEDYDDEDYDDEDY